MDRIRRILLTLMLAPFGAVPAWAQESTTCSSCRIVLERIVRVGDTDGPGAMEGWPQAGTVDGRGRIVIVQPSGPPIVFGPNGSYVAHLGAEGQGPGEVIRPKAVEARGDSLFVYDVGNRRVTVFGPALDYVRDYVLEARVFDAVGRGDGWTFVAGVLPTGPGVGHAMHLLDESGQVQRSWDRFVMFYGDAWGGGRRLAGPTNSGGVWAADIRNRLRLVEYDEAGREPRTLALERSWWIPYGPEPSANFDPKQGPRASVRGIWLGNGLVWILAQGVDPAWTTARTRKERVEGRELYDVDYDEAFDMIVEAVDPRTGRGIARRRWDTLELAMVLAPGLVGAVETDDLGWHFVTVFQVSLVGHTDSSGNRE